ncbi:hypothetical protein HUU53_00355 [Candidatus Micrarchaeota archaeon]|nr:hypothetical protein [Candidatus Micrarchaeota archaeon]
MPLLHESLSDFQEQVRKSKGRIIAIIHPYYGSKKTLEKPYLDMLKKVVEKSRFPIVVFEEEKKAQETQENIPNAFMVHTFSGDPKPLMTWQSLHSLLKEAGVSQIQVGGRYAHFDEPIPRYHEDMPPYVLMVGCVSGAYKEFVWNGFKARVIPELLYPDKPKLVRK